MRRVLGAEPAGQLAGVTFEWVPEIEQVSVDVGMVGGQHFAVVIDWEQANTMLCDLADALAEGAQTDEP